MSFLHVSIRVSEDSLTISNLELGLFWSGKAVIQHHLVVFHQIHFSLVFIIEVVLTLAILITFLCHCGGVALVSGSKPVLSLIVLSQVVVERALAVSWCVLHAQATRHVRDVGISTATIIHIHDGLGMDGGEVVSWALLEVVESA